MVNFSSIHLALAIAIQRNIYVQQTDVRTAFLHGKLNNSDVFVILPPSSGMHIQHGQAINLHKGFYGLKQALKIWFEKWDGKMKGLGFIQW